ncbi:MAG: beta-lactamase family protein [Proteobacteria bacterium]|jgi:CubicO group peptidase (beta-lactamase class C family)|nr:beta-lactamase family protein [Pseudomonadota bacterium]
MVSINAAPEDVGMNAQRLERIAPALQRYVDAGTYGGFHAMVMRRGRLVHAARVGWQDREAGIAMADDTIFRIYSMTKPIICTALMLLYEEGRCQLVDPVSKFIPAFAGTKVLMPDGSLENQHMFRPMQVRDVMSHTCGLTYDFFEDYAVGAQYREARLMNDATRTLETLIDDLARIPLAFHPGTAWHYGLGIDVAAQLIQVLANQPLGDFLRERLFAPLGMSDTGFGVAPGERNRLAAMYGHPDLIGRNATFGQIFQSFLAGDHGRRDAVAETYPCDAPATFQRGGLGLFSTASDYLAFARMLLDGRAADGRRIIGRKTLEVMHCNHLTAAQLPITLGGVPMPGWGFGLGSRVAMDVGQLGVSASPDEFGWAGAAKTYYWVDPREELAAVLMTQFMIGFDLPENDFRALVYQAIDD